MARLTSFDLTLTLGVLALAACGENTIPTQPETAGSPAAAIPSVDRPELLSSGLGTWTTRAPMPTPRYNLAGNVVYNASGQPILYAIGGDDQNNTVIRQVEAYNFATNTWSRKASLPHPRAQTNGAAVIAGKIYVSGGVSSSGMPVNSLYVYDPASNTWLTRASMPVTGETGLSGAINGKLYVLVGYCGTCSTPYPHRLYRYDPSSNTWTRRADCPRQHVFGTASVIDGKLYVMGGDDGTFERNSGQGWLDVYDPVTNAWTAGAPGNDEHASGAAAALAKRLYVLGGNNGEEDVAAVDAYEPATNTWAAKTPMKTARAGLVARTVTYGGVSYILAVGGIMLTGEVTGTLERYTP